MSTQPAQDRAADAAFLSKLTRYVRENPNEFRNGAELLERYFSVAACRRREAHEARGFRNTYARGNPIWVDTLERLRSHNTRAARESGAMRLSLWSAERWVRDGEDPLQRDEAEAVCLVVVCVYDDNPARNDALPVTLRDIPWGGYDEATGAHVSGRFFRAFGLGMDRVLLERARIAWARFESWGRPLPSDAAVATPRTTTSVPVDAAAAIASDEEARRIYANLSPAVRLAFEQFNEACAALPDVTSARPDKAHHRYVVEQGRAVVDWRSWRRYVSEALRKLLGPVKHRSVQQSRSAVRARDEPRQND